MKGHVAPGSARRTHVQREYLRKTRARLKRSCQHENVRTSQCIIKYFITCEPRTGRTTFSPTGRTTVDRRANHVYEGKSHDHFVNALHVFLPLLRAPVAGATNAWRAQAFHRQAVDLCLPQGHGHHLPHSLGPMVAFGAHQQDVQRFAARRPGAVQDVIRNLRSFS